MKIVTDDSKAVRKNDTINEGEVILLCDRDLDGNKRPCDCALQTQGNCLRKFYNVSSGGKGWICSFRVDWKEV